MAWKFVCERMPDDMIDALLEIIDAKIATASAADSSDGGLTESVRENALIHRFRERFSSADFYEALRKERGE